MKGGFVVRLNSYPFHASKVDGTDECVDYVEDILPAWTAKVLSAEVSGMGCECTLNA